MGMASVAPFLGYVWQLVCSERLRGSIVTPGIFFRPFPTRPCFCPPTPPHQTLCPQELSGDVDPSEFVPFYWGPPRNGRAT